MTGGIPLPIFLLWVFIIILFIVSLCIDTILKSLRKLYHRFNSCILSTLKYVKEGIDKILEYIKDKTRTIETYIKKNGKKGTNSGSHSKTLKIKKKKKK